MGTWFYYYQTPIPLNQIQAINFKTVLSKTFYKHQQLVTWVFYLNCTAQRMKFFIKDFFHRKLQIWSHLLKKFLMKNFILCAVLNQVRRLNLAKFWLINKWRSCEVIRGRSRAAATSKMKRYVIIVNGWKPLTIITKFSILEVAVALDPPRYP